MSNIICLVVGTSGSGKSTTVERMCEKYGLKSVESYTTRPKRYPNEKGHIFVTEEEFDKLNVCAYTEIKGYKYGATADQVEDADLYIIDEEGIEFFDKFYKGNKRIKVVRIYLDEDTCLLRMKRRGDSIEDIHFRMMFDRRRAKLFNEIVTKAKNIHRNDVLYVNVGQRTTDDIAEYIYKYIFQRGDSHEV